jgi:hypothetical protein
MVTITKDGQVQVEGLAPLGVEDFGDFRLVKKKPVIVHAMEMHQPFRAEDQKGNMTVGDRGDYLMKGINGEFYCCPRDVFFKSYDRVL